MGRDKPDFGHAVEDGFLRYTSVSAVQAFDPNTYGGCNRKFYFTRVLRMKEPTKKSQETGVKGHEEIEHYLKHGEDVLGPFARSGKHLLPKPGPDLVVEGGFATEEGTKEAIALRVAGGSSVQIERLAGFAAAGVPFVGYIDFRHQRGEYIDGETCALVREESPHTTAEVGDHKFISSIDDYAKTKEQLLESIQMVVYGVRASTLYPIDRVRLGHINYQTRGVKRAKKVSTLVPVEDLIRRKEHIDGVVRAMVDVARVSRIEEVEPHGPSCDAFRGCYFMSSCPNRPTRTIHDLLNKGGTSMGTGLFDQLSKGNGVQTSSLSAPAGLFSQSIAPPPPPPPAPMGEAERQAAVDAEKKRLLAEDTYGTCSACSASLSVDTVSRLQSGKIVHIGCPMALPPPPPPAAFAVGAVNPPDAPPRNPVTVAEPLSPEVIAAIEDSEVRKRAEDHAAAWKAAQPPPPPGSEKKSGKCERAGERIQLTQEQAAKKRYLCSCGKELKIKPSSDYKEATLPGHLMPKSEGATTAAAALEPPPPPPPIPETVLPPPLPAQTLMPPPLSTQAQPPSEVIALIGFIEHHLHELTEEIRRLGALLRSSGA